MKTILPEPPAHHGHLLSFPLSFLAVVLTPTGRTDYPCAKLLALMNKQGYIVEETARTVSVCRPLVVDHTGPALRIDMRLPILQALVLATIQAAAHGRRPFPLYHTNTGCWARSLRCSRRTLWKNIHLLERGGHVEIR